MIYVGLATEKPRLALTLRLRSNRNLTVGFYPIDLIGGERGTQNLDPDIVSRLVLTLIKSCT
jgi:hypothetical protein